MKLRLKILALLCVLLAVAIISFSTRPITATPDSTLSDISSYKQWTKVTRKPVAVENSFFGGG